MLFLKGANGNPGEQGMAGEMGVKVSVEPENDLTVRILMVFIETLQTRN